MTGGLRLPARQREGGVSWPSSKWQTRREAGTQSYGLLTVLGGTDKAARLPKGWTGPVSMLGCPGFRKGARIFFGPHRESIAQFSVFRSPFLFSPAFGKSTRNGERRMKTELGRIRHHASADPGVSMAFSMA